MDARLQILSTLLLAVSLGAPAVHANDRHDLILEQQQDALDLALRHHGLTAQGANVSAGDRLEIDRLRSQQRLEQQRLEIDQWQRQRALGHSAPSLGDDETRRRLYIQQDAFRTERQLQSQRFYLEQQRLMQSATREPLQPAPPPGSLRLR